MSRNSSNNQNPYKETVPFFDTFNKEQTNLQTAQFKSSSPPQGPQESDKTQSVLVLMAAEFERLHGINQVLILRYKDLEARFEAKEKENIELKQRINAIEDSNEKASTLNSELEHSKAQISDLIVQLEDLKAKSLEKDNVIASLKIKGPTSQPSIPVVQSVRTEGVFADKEELLKKKEMNYNSEPLRGTEHDIKNYDYYSKLYEAPKGPNAVEQQPGLFYSPDKQQIESPGLHVSGEYDYKADYEHKPDKFYLPEEEFSKKYGTKEIIKEDYSNKKYGGSQDEDYSNRKFQDLDYSNKKFGAYDYKIQEESSKKYGSQDDEYSSQKYGGSDYKRPENDYSAQKYAGGLDYKIQEEYGSKNYGGYEDSSKKEYKEEDYSKKYGSLEYSKQEEDSKKYALDYNKPASNLGAGLTQSREFESSRRFDEPTSGLKGNDFDYKKGYQYQYYEEGNKY